jgi:hypothetical protein
VSRPTIPWSGEPLLTAVSGRVTLGTDDVGDRVHCGRVGKPHRNRHYALAGRARSDQDDVSVNKSLAIGAKTLDTMSSVICRRRSSDPTHSTAAAVWAAVGASNASLTAWAVLPVIGARQLASAEVAPARM